MDRIISIVRQNETIFQCLNAWYIPRIGETVALAKWDTVYTVVDVFIVFGKGEDVETVTVKVEIKNS